MADHAENDPGPSTKPKVKKRRQGVSTKLACNSCRRRKTGCDERKPVCTPCEGRNLTCTYERELQAGESRQAAQGRELQYAQSTIQDANAILHLLRSSLPPTAQRVLNNARPDADPASTFAAVRRELEHLQHIPSLPAEVISTARSIPALEHELTWLHPMTYPTLVPVSSTAVMTNPGEFATSHQRPAIAGLPDRTSAVAQRYLSEPDEGLKDLQIRTWTKVPITNEKASYLLSVYLSTDHPILGFFDANLFVTDLVAGRTDFCSQILVVALLLWSCQAYGTSLPDRSALCRQLLAEAKQIWPSAIQHDNIHTVAASQLLCFVCACTGNDRLSSDFKRKGAEMGLRMGLFGVDKSLEDVARDDSMQPSKHQATAHVAWGSYNWLVLHSQYYGEPPPGSPPTYPIPYSQSRRRRPVVGQVSPSPSESDLPKYASLEFPEICKFRRIMNEVNQQYHTTESNTQALSERIPLHFATRKYYELLAWAGNLDDELSRHWQARPQVQVLHIWYHTALMDIWRPFLHRGIRIPHPTSTNRTPDTLFAASLEQLKDLAVSYRITQPSASSSILWHTCLLYIGNTVLRKDYPLSDWPIYLRLCVQSYTDLSASYPLAAGFLQGLLALAIQSELITVAEAAEQVQLLNNATGYEPHGVRSAHILDLDLALIDQNAAVIETHVERLDTAVVREEMLSRQRSDGSRRESSGTGGDMDWTHTQEDEGEPLTPPLSNR